ncbi:MAG: polynucleotide adenylyltransferase PcnB [Marinagarivorans sp.]|nr:polynucleotide adenylyltransferase PcnB [Marinagarivorans sp.]
MLKRLIKLLSPNSSSAKKNTGAATIHDIKLHQLSPSAIKVCAELQKANFEAYIVGGGIRDSLLNAKPKDFDVATSATPEQVRRVFRSSRIIGRRFKIVHVRFGHEIIEVTTFRGSHQDGESRDAVQSEEGLLLRDNVYGDMKSDAIRRDFTVNALYYDPIKCQIYDFTNGLDDIKSRTLRIIGDANERYKEDPVRMLRAARFAAKLAFKLDPATENPIYAQAQLLEHIPSARLFEEVLKLFLGGYATATFASLEHFKLLEHILPGVAPLVDASDFNRQLVDLVCINTDKRIRQEKRVTPAFIFAALLWLPLQKEIKRLIASGTKPREALNHAMTNVISQQLARTAIPKRFTLPMRDMWYLQNGLEQCQPKYLQSIVQHEKFRAAYDFLLLREDAGENHNGAGQFWTEYQFADEANQERMATELGQRNHAASHPSASAHDKPTGNSGDAASPAHKPRRRRRKPAGAKPAPSSDN